MLESTFRTHLGVGPTGPTQSKLVVEGFDFDSLLHEPREFAPECGGPDMGVVDEVIPGEGWQLSGLVEYYLVVPEAITLQPFLSWLSMFINPCRKEADIVPFFIELVYRRYRILEGSSGSHPFRTFFVPDVLAHCTVYVDDEDLPIPGFH